MANQGYFRVYFFLRCIKAVAVHFFRMDLVRVDTAEPGFFCQKRWMCYDKLRRDFGGWQQLNANAGCENRGRNRDNGQSSRDWLWSHKARANGSVLEGSRAESVKRSKVKFSEWIVPGCAYSFHLSVCVPVEAVDHICFKIPPQPPCEFLWQGHFCPEREAKWKWIEVTVSSCTCYLQNSRNRLLIILPLGNKL